MRGPTKEGKQEKRCQDLRQEDGNSTEALATEQQGEAVSMTAR